jgi:hypothetical protein
MPTDPAVRIGLRYGSIPQRLPSADRPSPRPTQEGNHNERKDDRNWQFCAARSGELASSWQSRFGRSLALRSVHHTASRLLGTAAVRDPPIWPRFGQPTFHARGAPNMMFCRDDESPRAIKVPDPMPAVGPSVQPCATGGRSAGRPACSGARPRRRVSSPPCLPPCSAHQHACRPGTPRPRVRSREPAGWLPVRTVPVSGGLPRAGWRPEVPAQVCHQEATRIWARGGAGTPLKVIWLFPPTVQAPPAYSGETGWLLAIGMLCQVTMPCDGRHM